MKTSKLILSCLISIIFISAFNSLQANELIYSTYLGGSGRDEGFRIVSDNMGNVFIVGITDSSDFPTTVGSYDTSFNGNTDVFIAKFNLPDTTLIYCTLLGGSGDDRGEDCILDPNGNLYITGETGSTDYPITSNAYDTSYNGSTYDCFISKVNSNGDSLVFSTFLGDGGVDLSLSMSIDTEMNIYITGYTSSLDFPITIESYDTSFNYGFSDIFISKFDPTGVNLVYSTLLGGDGDEISSDIIVDNSGIVYITGWTDSSTFPTTVNAYDSTYNSFFDAYIAILNINSNTLEYSSFFGGNTTDVGSKISIDNNENIYMVGYTYSSVFPTTPFAFDTIKSGLSDVIVLKLNSSNYDLLFSTFIGGNGYDYGRSISTDSIGSVYITGNTGSSNFPTTISGYDWTWNGNYDAFVSKLNKENGSLNYSTYLGGSGADRGFGLAIDTFSNVYITGFTDSSLNFPITLNAFETTYNGGTYDCFLSIFNLSGLTEIDNWLQYKLD